MRNLFMFADHKSISIPGMAQRSDSLFQFAHLFKQPTGEELTGTNPVGFPPRHELRPPQTWWHALPKLPALPFMSPTPPGCRHPKMHASPKEMGRKTKGLLRRTPVPVKSLDLYQSVLIHVKGKSYVPQSGSGNSCTNLYGVLKTRDRPSVQAE